MSEPSGKTSHELYTVQYKLHRFIGPPCGLYADDVSNFSRVSYKTSVGVKKPDYKSLIKLGRDASTSYQLDQETVKVGSWGYYNLSGSNGGPPFCTSPSFIDRTATNASGNLLTASVPDPSGLSITTARNGAIKGLLNAYDRFISGVNLGEDFGELKQTLNGMRRPLEPLRDLLTTTSNGFIRRVSTGRWGSSVAQRVKNLDKVAADTYLEFQFGWNPLAKDIAEAYVHGTSSTPFWKTKPLGGKGSDRIAGSSAHSVSGSGPQIITDLKQVGSATVRFIGAMGVTSGIGGGRTPSWGALPSQYISTAYNLIPWSFVVDYFSNLGDIVQRIGTISTRFVYLVECVERRYDSTWSVAFIPDIVIVKGWSSSPASVTISRLSYSRIPRENIPFPTLQVSLPKSGSRAWLNMAALAISRKADVFKAVSRAIAR